MTNLNKRVVYSSLNTSSSIFWSSLTTRNGKINLCGTEATYWFSFKERISKCFRDAIPSQLRNLSSMPFALIYSCCEIIYNYKLNQHVYINTIADKLIK